MAEEMTKEERIFSEIRKLKRRFSKIDPVHKGNAQDLIERAAYQKVMLQNLEADLDENGYVEPFTQGDNTYDRKRPAADLYISVSAQYQRTIKQLDAMLPKSKATNVKDDELLAFLNNE